MLSRAQAVTRIRAANRAVGEVGKTLLERLLINDLSISAIARLTSRTTDKVSGAADVVLDRLAEHYADGDTAARAAQRATIVPGWEMVA